MILYFTCLFANYFSINLLILKFKHNSDILRLTPSKIIMIETNIVYIIGSVWHLLIILKLILTLE